MIALPKMNYRFKVDFASNNQLHDLSVISRQITAISTISQIKGISGGTMFIKVDDEISGDCIRALQELMQAEDFTMIINHLDGNESSISRFTLSECNVTKITYGELDYAGGGVPPTLKLKTPFRGGNLIESMKDDPFTIVNLVNGMELTFEDSSIPIKRSVIEHIVYMSFKALEITS